MSRPTTKEELEKQAQENYEKLMKLVDQETK